MKTELAAIKNEEKKAFGGVDYAKVLDLIIPEKESGNNGNRELFSYEEKPMMRYFDDIMKKYPLLSRAETIELEFAPDKEEKLVLHNLRLVRKIANQHIGRGVDLGDLVGEGVMGLITAAKKFNFSMGFAFSTYASWWIKQSISRTIINNSNTIRIPVRVFERMIRFNNVLKSLAQSIGREPTIEDVKRFTGMNERSIADIARVVKISNTMSLEEKVDAETGLTLGEMIGDHDSLNADRVLEKIMIKDGIDRVLGLLTSREKNVIIMRFGLNGKKPHTLEQIGRHMGKTRERIRQIEEVAMRKLKHSTRLDILKRYYEPVR